MTSIRISEADIPELPGKVAVVTGGSSGIGYATAKILATKGAIVHLLDLNPPTEPGSADNPKLRYSYCDITSWIDLQSVFQQIGLIDMCFANAGVSEDTSFREDRRDEEGRLLEPRYDVINVNLRAVLNVVKLSWSVMRHQHEGGSIVLTTSATAYAPEQSLPVYSAVKLALVGLVRSLRSTLPQDGITINAVAPAATVTKLLPEDLAAPIVAAGLPLSDAHFVGLALAFSATARETRRVEAYGKEDDSGNERPGRWNGRVILTLGDSYTELEEGFSSLRGSWFGHENEILTKKQQAATDSR